MRLINTIIIRKRFIDLGLTLPEIKKKTKKMYTSKKFQIFWCSYKLRESVNKGSFAQFFLSIYSFATSFYEFLHLLFGNI